MGRLSRYKKTKSCDPFFKGTKKDEKNTLQGRNTVRNGKNVSKDADEQKMPRSMKILLERAKKMKNMKAKKSKRLGEETKPKKQAMFLKKKNEKKREYFDRIEKEASSVILETLKSQKKMSDRRKSHLNKRKEKVKIKKNPARVLNLDFSDLKDDVRFGDVASQPPMLTAKPRKAPLQEKRKSDLLLNSKLTQDSKTKKSIKEDQIKKSKTFIVKAKKRKHMTEGEKMIMDKERLRIIELYRKAKKTTHDKQQS